MNSPEPASNSLQTRFCCVCNKVFSSSQPLKVVCSRECKQKRRAEHARAAYRRRVGIACRSCGDAFTPMRLHQQRCNTCECEQQPARPSSWPPSICETCTKPILTPWKRHFCSHACWVAERYERRCTACGNLWNPTDRPLSQAASECWLCRSSDHVEGGRRWEGVREFRKRQLLRRENGRCQDCDATEESSGAPLHAHHIAAQALGGAHDLANLKLLCEDCHAGSGWARNHADLIAAGLAIPPVGTQLAFAA